MRDYIFRGKRVDNDEWVEGYYVKAEKLDKSGYEHFIIEENAEGASHLVFPESVGQWTGMNEFVVSDRSFNKPLFEGDIVEVWSTRRPKWTSSAKSQYDGDVKIRAVIRFRRGSWCLDDENKYNESLAKLRGRETDERDVGVYWAMYSFGSQNEEWDREHNSGYKWCDIVKIGTVFENADLLEG
jgi:hypothetical protein